MIKLDINQIYWEVIILEFKTNQDHKSIIHVRVKLLQPTTNEETKIAVQQIYNNRTI